LLGKNRELQAAAILGRIGNDNYVTESVTAIKKSIAGVTKVDYKLLLKKAMFPAVLTGIALAIFQQFCGINIVFNYAPKIFESIGASKDDQLLQIVFIGTVNLVFTVVAMALVDKVGRKPLMLFGAGGLCVLYILIVRALSANSSSVSWLLLTAIGTYAMA